MITQYEGISLIESEFPQLARLYKRSALGNDIHKSIQRLLDFSKEAVTDYNLDLSRKCFSLARRLLTQGDTLVRTAVEKSFIYSFLPFVQKDDAEKKRLKFFIPEDFYQIFLHQVEKRAGKNSPKKENTGASTDIIIRPAGRQDWIFAKAITQEMYTSALARGCGISRRSPLSLIRKMIEGKAIIALTRTNQWVGFCYLETYENNAFVSNSGLIVSPDFRQCGVAKALKQSIFDLSRAQYPLAKIFSITTGSAVMKMNTRLGFAPVTYAEITQEKKFWEGCKSCVNYQALLEKGTKNCFCTAMLYTPAEEAEEQENESEMEHFK
ncbi:GNAT family N-acetyltransferase [Dyadobacter sp. LHD-138]|uniref:GNAT family N-acetyltransferase n=1 Tax=Dyadobacter sp. LHD-138 TaxID=3071413 RepID=UPI0027E0B421|nr:GNAT family N-acetyltransferase [Dyadobacter sp. LHD-138]MDQ6482545.1 GNAT family N-acetyltransferase [Dyadobacter sp. LHD-138]